MSDVLITAIGVLDSLPNAGRALLSGAVLAIALVILESRLPHDCSGLAIAFRKTALLALVAVPLLICAVLDLRVVVVVEELPSVGRMPALASWGALAVWAAGAIMQGAREVRRARALNLHAGDPDAAVLQRAEFWRRRIGLSPPVAVRRAAGEDPSTTGLLRPAIYLPRSAGRWPVTVQDAVLVHELLLVRHRDWAWLVLGRVVAALYWPVPQIARLTEDLRRAFQHAGDARAIEYFDDRLGYVRALRHVAQRIDPLPHEEPPHEEPTKSAPLLGWQDSAALEQRAADLASDASRDPCYEKVFWAMAQATLAVFLLTGTTLQRFYVDERPPFVPDAFWYVSFDRSARYEDVKDWSSAPPAARKPRIVNPIGGASP